MSETEPLSWHTLITVWDMPLAAPITVGAAVALYLYGARRSRGWPLTRIASFLAAALLALVAVGGSVNAYSHVLFSMHMAQHLLLIMVVPTLVILGRPLELLRRTAPPVLHSRLTGLADGRTAHWLTHPVFTALFYAAVVLGTHLTPFQQYALRMTWLHGLEELLYLVSGYLLLLPVLGTEPIRRRMAHLGRLLVMVGGMLVDTVAGVTLMLTTNGPFPAYAAVQPAWGPGVAEDLHLGGAIMWVGGDLLMAVLAIMITSQWVNSPGGRSELGPWLDAARRSALTAHDPDRASALPADADVDNDEEALRAYNAMLARLAEQDTDRRAGPQ